MKHETEKQDVYFYIFYTHNRMKPKCTNLGLFAPHVQVLALSFGEMVPCLLFGSSLEYRHNLFNCGGMQGRSRDHPETETEKDREQLGGSRGVRKWSQLGISTLCEHVCVCHTYRLMPWHRLMERCSKSHLTILSNHTVIHVKLM